jgi:hypothetical protein
MKLKIRVQEYCNFDLQGSVAGSRHCIQRYMRGKQDAPPFHGYEITNQLTEVYVTVPCTVRQYG